jgi:hypothetical protein
MDIADVFEMTVSCTKARFLGGKRFGAIMDGTGKVADGDTIMNTCSQLIYATVE